MKAARAAWLDRQSDLDAESLIFIDEKRAIDKDGAVARMGP